MKSRLIPALAVAALILTPGLTRADGDDTASTTSAGAASPGTASAGTASGADSRLTFAKDAAPIIYSRCVNCHRPGQVAPMSLLRYGDVRPWARSIKKAVSDKSMPPWFATGEHGTFSNDSRLTDEEIATLVAWVDQGAAAGDPYDMPPVPRFKEKDWQIGTPDAVFEMTEPFRLGDSVEDHYDSFIVPTYLKEDRWLSSVEIQPGNMEVVHHVLVFSLATAGGGTGGLANLGGESLAAAFTGGTFLAKYAPGNNPTIFPEGFGKMLPAGSTLIFQMHYHKETGEGTATSDRTRIGVTYAPQPAKHPVTTAWILNPMLQIPPGRNALKSSAIFEFTDDGYIHSLFPHMHYRGKQFSFEAILPDGSREMLLDVPRYNFDWQLDYMFREPKFIPKGTKIRATGVFDNSASNTWNPDPAATVTWGEETTDEMMLGLMDYNYVTRKDKQGIIGLPEMLSSMLPPDLTSFSDLKSFEAHAGDLLKQFGQLGK